MRVPHWYYIVFTRALHVCCNGAALVLQWRRVLFDDYAGSVIALVPHRFSTDTGPRPVQHMCCTCTVLVLHVYYSGTRQLLHRCCSGAALVPHEW